MPTSPNKRMETNEIRETISSTALTFVRKANGNLEKQFQEEWDGAIVHLTDKALAENGMVLSFVPRPRTLCYPLQ